ncbi:efflux RND transporter periplasmic adaptor subunit [Desulfolutivibrio sulfoxidireducens]|uniref:efflux RND transporter periplasmic adaptor subunit n=1 Tax=Desulfolutivibrio sulfoxidireducens TaxID=2773299 RepID=UPI00159D6E12|nr:efflux RND transporter periplasmic adaptor subunit [Desulfolutivibrio sulfoxidireducens]QLA19108.1 efflux RND transporter periplasmic adaptor subunit [Desulfolutivibrio sulfoxidireducens]
MIVTGSNHGRLWRFAAMGTLVMVALLGLAACSEDTPPFAKPPTPVEAAAVEATPVGESLVYSASLIPNERVEMAFKVGGYVKDIATAPGPDGRPRILQKGDKVARDMILAALRDDDYQAALRKASAARDEELASLREAQVNFDRYQTLFNQKVVAKSEYDKAKEKLDYYKASVDRTTQQIEEAGIQLRDTVLKSPLDALVLSRSIEKGTLVASGTLAFVLADLSTVKAVFGVPDFMLRFITPGDAVPVTVEALGNEVFPGTVLAVAPSADPKSRVFDVEVRIVNPDLRLKDGMIASARLSGDTASRLVVPINAVVRDTSDPKGFMVYVIDEAAGKATARKVILGDVVGNRAILSEGPAPGEKVITTGATMVHDGAPVRLIK